MSAERDKLISNAIINLGIADTFPGSLIIEGWHQDPRVQKKWERNGFVVLFAMSEQGLIKDEFDSPALNLLADPAAPYGETMRRIEAGINKGTLHSSAFAAALEYMMHGTLEETELSQFIPRQ